MARLNSKPQKIRTHEGGIAKQINTEMQLRRSIMACMLWEDSFYESGENIAKRISDLCRVVSNEKIAEFAIEARNKQKLRHVPLLLCVELLRKQYNKTADIIAEIIQRPDELTEIMAVYWRDGKCPISAQLKKGLARAFTKFNEYQLAKYNRDNAIKLRDVLFLCHAKPKNNEQADLWKRLINKKLQVPDTWEVNLSTGKDKKETWERLINQDKLGALAFLRNLRNMQNAGLDRNFIKKGLSKINPEKVLPFRFISAAKYAPFLESDLENKMFECLFKHDKLQGNTILFVDVSGSMGSHISNKSDLMRIDAAYGLAILLREICLNVSIFTFSNKLCEVPNRRGFALADAIYKSQNHSGTYLGDAINSFIQLNIKYDRFIVITDEQTADSIPHLDGKTYMINVASEKNGVGYYDWIHIDGWSESIIDYIMKFERCNFN